ncbi:MAG: thioesterase family protein [Planctomycetota bacterium]|jgi:4-hydroxybenzoyl-CoA thioesterase|nr:thioesterase family protein [Planctomycetota bacterium]MDP6763202.1 thioesterase family protein [Planctomycetota bacterium]MDP6990589.1 thioesterase family protein [Planctomycetota bacterium]
MNAYETAIQVRFGHVDPAGIVYFPRIYDYVHDVFEQVWEEHVGERYYDLLSEQNIAFPLVHADVDFRSPLRFGDTPTVRVTAFRLGRSSLGLHYVFSIGGRVCVDARMTTVCVEANGMRTQAMPEAFRTKFEEILERKVEA